MTFEERNSFLAERWRELPEDEKEDFNSRVLSDEVVSDKEQINRTLKKVKRECQNLKDLGVKCLFICDTGNGSMDVLGHPRAIQFVENFRLAPKFYSFVNGEGASGGERITTSSRSEKEDLRRQVIDLFNRKYSEACGKSDRRVPYKDIKCNKISLLVENMGSLSLKHPSGYGVGNLKKIIAAKNDIIFKLTAPNTPIPPQTISSTIPLTHTTVTPPISANTTIITTNAHPSNRTTSANSINTVANAIQSSTTLTTIIDNTLQENNTSTPTASTAQPSTTPSSTTLPSTTSVSAILPSTTPSSTTLPSTTLLVTAAPGTAPSGNTLQSTAPPSTTPSSITPSNITPSLSITLSDNTNIVSTSIATTNTRRSTKKRKATQSLEKSKDDTEDENCEAGLCQLVPERKKRRDERGENQQNWVYCEGCFKWFHFECVGIERVPDGPYFCGCKTKELNPSNYDPSGMSLFQSPELAGLKDHLKNILYGNTASARHALF
ncbi:probable serine/threonine-protein kinase dyrk2 [Orbicella faveolata]|uniref:probable serine/threonine-protein kinase dyrk2 n=1 Tax=Orbicella faveolata TaxID=48498 RepID=UPI0009E20D05|nr:probable serine/threonine-protein kinase dyrk2 [Orbicella faveolata]